MSDSDAGFSSPTRNGSTASPDADGAAPVPYRAPVWLPGGHAQTLYAALLAPCPRLRSTRSRWETPDGDFVDLDWVKQDSRFRIRDAEAGTRNLKPETWNPELESQAPLVVLFHGLEGGSRSHYARALMAALAARGWRGVVPHFRGCSGELNRLPRAYHSGDSAEIDWIVRRLKDRYPASPLYAVGVSLGGNALLKWLGESGASAREVVDRAVSVSAPLDLVIAGDALGRGFNLVYARYFLRTMKKKSLMKLDRFPGLYDAARVRAASTLREFDDVVTAPLHGFANTDDYWTRASAKPWLRHIAVRTLLVNARDDPFLPACALPQPHEVSSPVACDFPGAGGHAAFVSGAFPGNLRWLPRRVLSFFDAS